jgi:hypothetical protein
MILQKELISQHSSTWVGIQYFLVTGGIIFASSIPLQFVGIALDLNLFGFFYMSELQFFRLLMTSIFVGTLTSSFLLRNKIALAHNPKKSIYVSSVLLSLPFVLLACGAILDGHSDTTSLQNLLIEILLWLFLAIEHFILNKIFLKKFFTKNSMPTSVSTQSVTAETPITQAIIWNISGTERKRQIRTFILQAGLLFLVFMFILPSVLLTDTYSSVAHDTEFFIVFMYAVIGAVISLTTFYTINTIFPHKNRTYSIDETGLTISKGTKTKHFTWSDFTCFYQYSKRLKLYPSGNTVGDIQKSMIEVQNKIEGSMFYLQKKSGVFLGVGKVFVVIRTKPENEIEVIETLRKKLEEAPMTPTTDLGLVLYECK